MSNAATLGKFEIIRTLGEGGMGTVYLGYDKKLNRYVAIKTIRLEQMGEESISAEYARRFELEAKAIAMLNHTNIVTLYDFGEETDVAYLVMEFVEGHDLKYYFDQQTNFTLAETLRLMSGLLEALAHAHEKGVWHRDIKPANVMIDTNGQVKLTDFGVSRIADNSERSRLGTMVGTLNYMSPEQVLNTGVSHRSDIFAAGVILYQFLTKVRPFIGGDYEVANKIVQENPVSPSQLNPALPLQLDAVLAKALAKVPEQRYASAREFLHELKAACGDKQEPSLDFDATRHFYAAHGSKNTIEHPVSGVNGFSNLSQRTGSKSAANGTSLTSPSEHAEIEFWRSIKDGTDIEEFKLYVKLFPQGTYAALARSRIEKFASNSSVSRNLDGKQTSQTSAILPSDLMSDTRVMPPAPKSGGTWLMPSAIILAASVVAAAFWLTRSATVQNEISGTPPSKPIASLTTASSASQPDSPSKPNIAPVEPSGPTAAELAEKQRQETAKLEALKQEASKLQIQQAAAKRLAEKAEKDNRDKTASEAAKQNIERLSKDESLKHQCIGSKSFKSHESGKSEAESRIAATTNANQWVARWKSPEGISKGFDKKYSSPEIHPATCSGNEGCTVVVSYKSVCEN